MFLIWWDDLMDISDFVRTTTLRQRFVECYGWTAYNNWMGTQREES